MPFEPASKRADCATGTNNCENLLDRLKRETAYQHEVLEARLDLLRPELTIQEYTALLIRLYGFYKPWEHAVWPVLRDRSLDLTFGRQKVCLLENDLRALGIIPGCIPLIQNLPPLKTFAEAIGSLYVVEGSTLGSQILSRHFSRMLGLEDRGLSFFIGYGENTGTMWRSFRNTVIAGVHRAEEDAAVASAARTFEVLGEWLIEEKRDDRGPQP